MRQVGNRWTWDTPNQPARRVRPRQRGANAAKRARLAEIEATAVPGRHVVATGDTSICHWCGFRIGSGHPNCPDP